MDGEKLAKKNIERAINVLKRIPDNAYRNCVITDHDTIWYLLDLLMEAQDSLK